LATTLKQLFSHLQVVGDERTNSLILKGEPAAARKIEALIRKLDVSVTASDYSRCRSAIPTREWQDALNRCAEAAEGFSSAVVGIDLVFEWGLHRHLVLEVNAFGDFFPGWVADWRVDPHSGTRGHRETAWLTNWIVDSARPPPASL